MNRNLAVPLVDGADSGPAEQPPKQRAQKQRATSSPSSEGGGQKKAVDVACWPCRKRKAKCTAERPACTPCVRRGVECSYEYDEGLTKIGALKMRLAESTAKAESLAYLFEQLRTRSDEECSMLLAVIRLGADLDKIVAQLKSTQLLNNGAPPDMNQFMMGGVEGMDRMMASSSLQGPPPQYFHFDQTIDQTGPMDDQMGYNATQEGPWTGESEKEKD